MNYYQVLDVGKDASPDQIAKAFRKVAFEYLKSTNDETWDVDEFMQIIKAYEVLNDPGKRASYDYIPSGWEVQSENMWLKQVEKYRNPRIELWVVKLVDGKYKWVVDRLVGNTALCLDEGVTSSLKESKRMADDYLRCSEFHER